MTLKDTLSTVVVGIDDSEESAVAAAWAARLAATAGARLELVHAWMWPLYNVDTDPIPGVQDSGLRHGAEMLLAEAQQRARDAAPELEVITRLETGRAADVLLQASRDADLVVVGSRGLGRVLSIIIGSTGLALASAARSSVVVVRSDETPDGPVSIVYDGTAAGDEALAEGLAVARLVGAPVQVVHAAASGTDEAEVVKRAQDTVAERGKGLQVNYRPAVSRDDPRKIIEATTGSRLYVTGPRARRGDKAGVSAVSQVVLRFANCPVWLARARG